eukprot:TRINITY_DN14199_c0_g1_i1.p1 TRINITY_DN14199_c0_g1~~TRINITY_DN14199_c0_g1_i1.p1  ORF type:complete len:465 (-),score=95.62 TRINITY_DN14199_c0_g1_i1:13-1305(-)
MEKTLREAYSKIGLPWVESGPTTLSRAAFLLYEFGTNGLQIARFLRSVMGPMDGKVTEEHTQDLELKLHPSLFNLCLSSTTEILGPPAEVPEAERVLIIDVGSFFTKAGWASDSSPSVTFPSTLEDGSFPVDRGVVKDWKGFEFLVRKAYSLLHCSPSLYPVIICIAPKTPKGHKNEIAQIMFKTFQAPSILLASTSYCGLCSIDGMAACVVNVGGGIVHTVPYYEGLLISHAIQRLDVAGQDITQYVLDACTARGDSVVAQEVENFKSTFWVVHDKDFNVVEEEVGDKIIAHGFRPDGGSVPLSKEVFKGPEMLFRPQIIMREIPGIPEMIKKMISQCDLDTRKGMWENIIVTGGSSMFPGFIERLKSEIAAISPENITPVVKAAPNRFNAVHKGASNLAYYNEFFDWSITLDEYEIEGEEVFDSKCIN